MNVDEFLAQYDDEVRSLALGAIATIRAAVPDAIVRVYPGWRLVGFRKPRGRDSKYFAFVAPLDDHVRLGFEYGRYMRDPEQLLRGDGSQVRYIVLEPAFAPHAGVLGSYIREAVSVSLMNSEQRSEICRAT